MTWWELLCFLWLKLLAIQLKWVLCRVCMARNWVLLRGVLVGDIMLCFCVCQRSSEKTEDEV